MLFLAHRVARQFQEPGVAAFLSQITIPQLWHWLAVEQIERDAADPRGPKVKNPTDMAAVLMSAAKAAAAAKGKRP